MTDENRNAAIWYVADSFDASGKNQPVVGRTSAGEGFLKAFANHGNLDKLYCFTDSANSHDAFRSQMNRLCPKPRKTSLIEWQEFHKLEKPGCLYVPDPVLEVHAWNRRSLANQRGYSICGVTHTTASHQTIDAIGALLTAPTQSWDALICTSKVVHATVARLLDDLAHYLEERGAGRIDTRLQLPVIPIGIDTDQFESSPQSGQARQSFRQQLGAQEDDIVLLYLGRLSVNIKTNPWSMLTSLEKASKRTGRKLHLVMAGWFQDNLNVNAFSEAIKILCPSINAVLMDGRQSKVRKYIWFAADIFVSLIDNIQETFGISPLEAMATGLPVVVSDWNGYRDTVIDGETGFRIPTAFPMQGAGDELTIRYTSGLDSYETYLGHCSAATIIDETACVDAFSRLIEDSDLRKTMGENGRRHVRANFDWKSVIGCYQDLWEELGERRKLDNESVPLRLGSPSSPLRQDPFRLFSEYPTALVDSETRLYPLADVGAEDLTRACHISLFASARPLLLAENKCREILRIVEKKSVTMVGELEQRMKPDDKQRLYRSIAWLAKIGLIGLGNATNPGDSQQSL